MSAQAKIPVRMSVEEFLLCDAPPPLSWQLVDGVPLAMAPNSDLAVTCSSYGEEESTLADPVLVIEILSPSNRAETWANVFATTTIPSIREILVLDTVKIGAELVRRGTDGTWPRRPSVIAAGDVTLESIGFSFPLTAAYRTTRLASNS